MKDLKINIDESQLPRMPEKLAAALKEHGYEKVAASAARQEGHEVETLDFMGCAKIIGEKVAARQMEWRAINAGLSDLRDLTKETP